MIQYIHARLNQWGRVVGRGGMVRGLGYPTGSAFTRLTPAGHFDTGMHEGAWEIERCMPHLDHSSRQLCGLMYVQNQSWAQIAASQGVTQMTISNRLHRVHTTLLDLLNDLAAGIELPTIKKSA